MILHFGLSLYQSRVLSAFSRRILVSVNVETRKSPFEVAMNTSATRATRALRDCGSREATAAASRGLAAGQSSGGRQARRPAAAKAAAWRRRLVWRAAIFSAQPGPRVVHRQTPAVHRLSANYI